MKSFKYTFLIIIIASLLSSCATILSSNYQKIDIVSHSSDTVYVDGQIPKKDNGKYLIERDGNSKQITVKSEKYMDRNYVLMTTKFNPLYYIGLPLIIPAAMDQSPKKYNYPDSLYTKNNELKKLNLNMDMLKDIQVISAQVPSQVRISSYSNYLEYIRNEGVRNFTFNLGDTSVVQAANEIFVEMSITDTSIENEKRTIGNALNFRLNVKDYKLTLVHDHQRNLNLDSGSESERRTGFGFTEIEIDWQVLDFYNNVIFDTIITSKSGEYTFWKSDDLEEPNITRLSLKKAIGRGFVTLMGSTSMKDFIYIEDDSNKEIKEIKISTPQKHVSNLNQAISSSVTITTEDGFGSGFFISNNGYILTNYHIVKKSKDITVTLNDKSEHKATIERVDISNDLALIKIEGENYIPFKITESKNIPIASEVYAVGTPSSNDFAQSISKGIISGVRELGGSKHIQTDVSINYGNSGGPLVLSDGSVIGLVLTKLSGLGVEGIAFGIPVYEVLEHLNIVYE